MNLTKNVKTLVTDRHESKDDLPGDKLHCPGEEWLQIALNVDIWI